MTKHDINTTIHVLQGKIPSRREQMRRLKAKDYNALYSKLSRGAQQAYAEGRLKEVKKYVP